MSDIDDINLDELERDPESWERKLVRDLGERVSAPGERQQVA